MQSIFEHTGNLFYERRFVAIYEATKDSKGETLALLNSVVPLEGNCKWTVFRSLESIIRSKPNSTDIVFYLFNNNDINTVEGWSYELEDFCTLESVHDDWFATPYGLTPTEPLDENFAFKYNMHSLQNGVYNVNFFVDSIKEEVIIEAYRSDGVVEKNTLFYDVEKERNSPDREYTTLGIKFDNSFTNFTPEDARTAWRLLIANGFTPPKMCDKPRFANASKIYADSNKP